MKIEKRMLSEPPVGRSRSPRPLANRGWWCMGPAKAASTDVCAPLVDRSQTSSYSLGERSNF